MAGWSHDEQSVQRAVTLICEERAELVFRALLAPDCELDARQAIVFLKDVFVILSRLNAHDAMLAAALKVPARDLLSLVPIYYGACVLLHRRRFTDGFALLNAFRQRCLENLDVLPTEDTDGFLVLFRHALLLNDETYLADPHYTRNWMANQANLDVLHWAVRTDGDDDRPVVLVACDQRYADLFLARFVESLDRLCTGRLLHLHLVDPGTTPPVVESLPAPRRNRLAVTWEASGPLKCSAYYASARFVRAGELLRHYRRPLHIFDVDVALRHPLEPIDDAMTGADFGCFRTGLLNPCSEYLAEVTAYRPTPAGLELAELQRRLILAKMSMKRPLLWLIDQATLYSAIYILSEKAGRLRVADFTQRLGLRNDGYIQQCDPDAVDKLSLMKTAGA